MKPELVCEVRFPEWTDDGLMRQPAFLGLREDISPFDVRREKPERDIVAPDIYRSKISGDKTRITIDGIEVDLMNLKKIFWPDEGYTKGDMINYYPAIAPVILPYLKDRPQTMNRFPDGITGQSFFQKNVDDKIAPWIETVTVSSESKEKKSVTFYARMRLPLSIWRISAISHSTPGIHATGLHIIPIILCWILILSTLIFATLWKLPWQRGK